MGSLFLFLLEYRYIVNFNTLIFISAELFLMLNGWFLDFLGFYRVIAKFRIVLSCFLVLIPLLFCILLLSKPSNLILNRGSDGELPYIIPDSNGYSFFLLNSVMIIRAAAY